MKHESSLPAAPLRIVSLFSGIGGFELGMHRAGHQTVLMCESDPAARLVLRTNFPGIEIANDVVSLESLPSCDLLTAGWPCQDISLAGRTQGLQGLNSSLIEHVFRLLKYMINKPKYVLLENVAFALDLRRGEAVRHVTDHLDMLGYRWAYRILDTRLFGLPQRRRRLFVLGSLESNPEAMLLNGISSPALDSPANPKLVGFYWTEGTRGTGWSPEAVPPLKGGSGVGIPSPPAVWERSSGRFMSPGIEDAERLQGFPAGWTSPANDSRKGARARWRLVGNAVSVPVAEWIGKRLGLLATTHCVPPIVLNSGKLPRAACGGGGYSTTAFEPKREGPEIALQMNLGDFELLSPTALSARAVEGFARRYEVAPLKKNLEFLTALKAWNSHASSFEYNPDFSGSGQ